MLTGAIKRNHIGQTEFFTLGRCLKKQQWLKIQTCSNPHLPATCRVFKSEAFNLITVLLALCHPNYETLIKLLNPGLCFLEGKKVNLSRCGQENLGRWCKSRAEPIKATQDENSPKLWEKGICLQIWPHHAFCFNFHYFFISWVINICCRKTGKYR